MTRKINKMGKEVVVLTIELFGFKSSRYKVETEIINFFKKFYPKVNGLIIFYDIEPKDFKGDSAKVIKLITSDTRMLNKLRRKKFLQLACFEDVNIGLFSYHIVKKSSSSIE